MSLPAGAQALLLLGALNAALVVGAGAFGAHALKQQLSVDQAAWFQTAVQYHMFHALGLLALGTVAALRPGTLLLWAGGLMLAGIVLFCGSLYALALGAGRGWGAVAPIGGTAFIAAWVLFAIASLRAGA